MARARAAENPRSRPKGALIEEMTNGIDRFQEILAAIEDFGQEGFPYRDAAQAKAELQFRESVRRVFGERSQEFQTYRNYKLRASNKAEAAQSVAVIKGLMKTLEDRKLELQGLKPPAEAPPAEPSPSSPPQMTLVPPTAQISMGTQQVTATPPMTVSVALTTNLGTQANATATAPPVSTPPPVMPPPHAPVIPAPFAPVATPPATQSTPTRHDPPVETPAPLSSALRASDTVQPPPAAAPAVTPSPAPIHAETEPAPSAPAVAPARQPAVQSDPLVSASVPAAPVPLPTSRTVPDGRLFQPGSEQEPLQLLRNVCLRLHSVARQLRLRKDYRPTLEVEDDYDLQDLLCALLKVQFEEVGTDEWTPPYTGGAPRTTLFLNKDQIAVVAKKTRSGLSAKELADQVAADSAYYRAQDKYATLFVFIYDPEGRIGSPKRLESNLTSVSERCTVEVLVAPK
ncbi:MAG TPA: hypothetical protein VD738_05000 [Nitrospira sp.]|nr:hypothetical protein [Nitrospira sp.]